MPLQRADAKTLSISQAGVSIRHGYPVPLVPHHDERYSALVADIVIQPAGRKQGDELTPFGLQNPCYPSIGTYFHHTPPLLKISSSRISFFKRFVFLIASPSNLYFSRDIARVLIPFCSKHHQKFARFFTYGTAIVWLVRIKVITITFFK